MIPVKTAASTSSGREKERSAGAGGTEETTHTQTGARLHTRAHCWKSAALEYSARSATSRSVRWINARYENNAALSRAHIRIRGGTRECGASAANSSALLLFLSCKYVLLVPFIGISGASLILDAAGGAVMGADKWQDHSQQPSPIRDQGCGSSRVLRRIIWTVQGFPRLGKTTLGQGCPRDSVWYCNKPSSQHGAKRDANACCAQGTQSLDFLGVRPQEVNLGN
ncbi:uncharacterized protein LOC130568310 [Triplophysa rosa]|uniref:uncharacterized protein LOC130568310 n=1 Tax=Triplophysa rosa TaxID=992332 RepID=UPI002545D510|nr:uncharacterized protein LOC130568310 [Triplophysa rosa]